MRILDTKSMKSVTKNHFYAKWGQNEIFFSRHFVLYVLFNILNLLRRHDELLSNFSPAGFTFKGFVVCTMLLTEQRFFCLEVPLGDLGQLKGLLAPKQRLTEASMFTIPRFYFTTQSITLLK